MHKPRIARPSAAESPGAVPRQKQNHRFMVVGVGASAGGLEAYRDLLAHLPADIGMAFVLVQHLDPAHESELTTLLARVSAMPVREVTNNLQVEPDHVYVIPPNRILRIAHGSLKLRMRDPSRTPTHSIDRFFESLAEDQRERAIGVILSGTATDGTMGLEAIKAEGGITFAQDDSAKYDSMPRSAVAAGCVDFILSPEKIAKELARIAKHPYVEQAAAPSELEREADQRGGAEAPLASGGHDTPGTGALQARAEAEAVPEKGEEAAFKNILLLLRNHSGVDFSLYKSTTIQRRITRRMVLNKLTSLDDYAQFLKGNAKELDALYSDVLISVTSFFRTPEAFDVLKHKVFPKLLQQRGDEPVRVWVLGCSTGQEAYSIAMAFLEAAENAPRTPKLQVFATDLNETLLDKARHGVYAKSLVRDVSPQRLRRFFVEEEGGYRVSKPLREMVVFARQNLLSDPPFSRMDLISCRNLLIYLEPRLQKKVLPVFHYALKPEGFLFLGASESIGSFTNLFAPAHKRQKLYKKKAAPALSLQLPGKQERDVHHAPGKILHARPMAHQAMPEGLRAELNAQREADRVMVGQFTPPGVLINAEFQILQFRGATSAYLEPRSGKATFDVLKMARQGLMLPLRAAINTAKKENKPVRKENVRVEQNGATRTVDVEVIPLKNLRERCFLVVFEEAAKGARAASPEPPSGTRKQRPASTRAESRRIAALERELAETREYLESVQEQHEAATEELQASNEEVQSANEELQSINEELETSKEELESANEELTTVNEEMANRNAELNRLNADLTNLQASTKLPIVSLGRDLAVRRFSPPAEKVFNLLATDVGRPISRIRHNLEIPDLEAVIVDVITNVRECEREVQDKDGHWYSLHLRPYLSVENKVEGAVLVLVDIDTLKRNEQEIKQAREFAEATVRTTRDALVVLDPDLRVIFANRAFYQRFKLTPEETENVLIHELDGGQWNIPELRRLLKEILSGKSCFNDFEVTHDFDHIGRRTMLLNARRLDLADGSPQRILLAIEDVTERLEGEHAVRMSEIRYRRLFEAARDGVLIIDPASGKIVDVNPFLTELVGLRREEFLGKELFELGLLKDEQASRAMFAELQANGIIHYGDLSLETKGGERREIELIGNMYKEKGENIIQLNVRDVTDRKQAEEALRRSAQNKDEFLAMLAHELRNPLAPMLNAVQLMRMGSLEAHTLEWANGLMERQVRQMTRLVDDLLDISRISSGKISLHRESVELATILADAVEVSRSLIDARKQTLTIVNPEDPIWLEADRARLTQVVSNLVNNAAKYTAEGGRIFLIAEREGAQVAVRVQDTGLGIAPDMLPRVFDLFTQVDQSPGRRYGGLGVGLTLVRKVVELHGGTVEAFSEGLGKGSTFVVRLPLSPTPTQSAQALPEGEHEIAGRGRRVLVVDDNVDAAESVATWLQLHGHEVRSAQDGPAALEITRTWQPDAVLLDIGLQGMDGYEVARRLRQSPDLRNTRLVAVTGYGQEEDRRRSEQAGFDHHFVKPVDPHTLNSLLASLSPTRKAGGEDPA